jgi:membrane protein YqaA with SNARE-associated domain
VSPSPEPVAAENTADNARKPLSAGLVLRFVLGLVALLALVIVVVRALRPQLQAIGTSFVEHFGLGGMALGTFLADGFHFPLPPQFYMLLAIAAGTWSLSSFMAICAGSLAGGTCGYLLARRIARWPRLARWLARLGKGFQSQLVGANAYRGALIVSITPLAFSVLCYFAGLYRLPMKAFALVLVLRVPKLVLFYELVKLGWSGL